MEANDGDGLIAFASDSQVAVWSMVGWATIEGLVPENSAGSSKLGAVVFPVFSSLRHIEDFEENGRINLNRLP